MSLATSHFPSGDQTGFVSFPGCVVTGTLQGAVQDSNGAVVAGAEVIITNQNTNVTINTTTSGNGTYIAPQLPPGVYWITIKKSGFKTSTVAEIKLDVQQIRAVDVTLDVGQTTETVSVSASGTAAIETVSSTVSQTIENKRIVDLPLNGRNPFSLATMSPGVIPAPGSSPFISGGRNATSEVTIDGISNVNAENNVSILDLNYTPSVDAVQEFSVQTNSVSAEFGRLGGGVINLVTKNGANTFHWTAFEFHRNSALDATNFFTNRAGQKKGSFRRNQFGGNIGGPLIKEKTFFFVNYEGNRQGTASAASFTVPLPEWRRGDFSNLRNAAHHADQRQYPAEQLLCGGHEHQQEQSH
ncbi:MAG: carboxypeptidase regulatory-like domain-containing protein [Blastocatellia bacterium]